MSQSCDESSLMSINKTHLINYSTMVRYVSENTKLTTHLNSTVEEAIILTRAIQQSFCVGQLMVVRVRSKNIHRKVSLNEFCRQSFLLLSIRSYYPLLKDVSLRPPSSSVKEMWVKVSKFLLQDRNLNLRELTSHLSSFNQWPNKINKPLLKIGGTTERKPLD